MAGPGRDSADGRRSGSVARGDIAAKLWRVHWPLLGTTALIATVGMLSLYSAAGGSFEPFAERHALRFILGVALVLAVALVPLRIWLGLAYPAYLVSLLLLGLVLLVGVDSMGARRWLGAGELRFQPAELMKIAIVMALARYYQWLPADKASRPVWVAIPMVMIAAPVALTLKQPDLGTAMLFAAVGLGIMFLAGVRIVYFLAGAATVAGLAPIVWHRLHDYQKRRITTFLDPEYDPLGAGYHIMQSKIALGSGGLTGKGYLQGTQSHLRFLPEAHTDFVFTTFAEEMGFIGAVALLVLYGVLLLQLLAIAMACRNQFARLLVGGTTLVLFVYVFINIAMVTGLVPVVGVPLPLVSYGGTAMVTLMLGLGLAMCGYVHRAEGIRHEDVHPLW